MRTSTLQCVGHTTSRAFLKYNITVSFAGVEALPGQQRQLSETDHQVGQSEPEQALEEPGELVRRRPRWPQQGTRPKRQKREVAQGRRRERRPDFGRGRKFTTLARRPLNSPKRRGGKGGTR